MKNYTTGRRNLGRPAKRLLDVSPELVKKWSNSVIDT
jgi:hypothetical protein